MAQSGPPKVEFKDGAFVVSGARGTEIVPIEPDRPAPGPIDARRTRFRFEEDGKTVWFDKKGIAFAHKRLKWKSLLKAVPTSGKIATKESNAQLVRLVNDGKRELEVSALSGWAKVGANLYLLARWEDADGRPWLEALTIIDMDQPKPDVKLVGKWPGLSFANGVVDNVVEMNEGGLSCLVNSDDAFGSALFDPASSKFDFVRIGSKVGKAKTLPGTTLAWTLTPMPYGTNVLGLADTATARVRTVAEVRGKMKGVVNPAVAHYVGPGGPRWINLHTGAETVAELNSQLRGTSNGILVWSPPTDPRTADLYDGSFRRIANWKWVAPVAVDPPQLVKTAPAPVAPRVAKPVKKGAAVNRPASVKRTSASKSKPTGVKTKGPTRKPSKPTRTSSTTKKKSSAQRRPVISVTSERTPTNRR